MSPGSIFRPSWQSLYKTIVRSHLEYAIKSVWNPYRMGLIKDLDKVQMHESHQVSNEIKAP